MLPILPVGVGLNPLGPSPSPLDAFGPGSPAASTGPGTITQSFGDLLGQALDGVNNTQAAADSAAQDLVTGKSTDIHTAMIAMEKAKVTFDLAVQVRDKSLDAYNEMMRLQV